MLLLVPSDPVKPRRADEHFAPEVSAARELGLDVAVVSLEALSAGDVETAVRYVPAADDAVYRGWMMRSGEYEQLCAGLEGRGCVMRTSPSAFRRAHELPGWSEAVAAVSPETRWTSSSSIEELVALAASMAPGSGVLRDFVKSMKHYWLEAVFIEDLADADGVRRVGERFVELRGESFVGGFVVRRFETFIGAEVRTWWVDGEMALVTAHPDTPSAMPPTFELPSGVAEAVAGLELPFVAVDFALRADGVWRLIELGDGQVSDRPTSTPARALVDGLRRRSRLVPPVFVGGVGP